MSKRFWLTAAAWVALIAAPAAAQVKVDEALPSYVAVQGVSGTIKSVGSDTMNNEMTLWAEEFLKFYPNIKIEIEGKGSTTGPPALIEGTSNFCPMSRPMKAEEIDAFEKKYGYKPLGLNTSIDMLAVYTHKDNPLKGMTMAQVDAVFSKTRKLGNKSDITTWGQLGLTGEWASKPISLYGRNSASGTYGYFKEHALGKGDYKDAVKEQPGSSTVVQGCASDKYAIGYSGIGYKTADVNAIPLATVDGEDPIPATPEFAYTGEYPLARYLIVYINLKPGEKLDPLRREFVKFILSKQGQEMVVKDGYFPITSKIAQAESKKAGLE